MKEARIHVDFNEMLEDDLVRLSDTDFIPNSRGKVVTLKEGMKVKIYADDLSSCGDKDNLIADGVVELNTHEIWCGESKWNCRIDSSGIYNESQKAKK
ncbi:MAG: hypothetical protein ACERKD_19660 [Prolixibacteraceae bacterium]